MRLELLSPAGNEEALTAAVQNGADAVYLGGRALGARASASNFYGAVLENSVRYCHLRGVRVYMTVNTLVKESEIEDGLSLVREAVQAGVDAYLVQDLGFAALLRQAFPGICLHASTQMSVNNESGALAARSMGMSRVVAARECSLDEIRGIIKTGIETEVFGHGALCMGFSGQCLFSSSIGGRSGNRGRCAQPCRLQYMLDGRKTYALSTKDLCTLFDLRSFLDIGVAAVKLEGRLKRPEYVAVVTAAYRRAIDLCLEGKVPQQGELDELLSVFNRGGFTRGFAFGQRDGDILFQQRPNHQGVYVGKIVSVHGGRARLKTRLPLRDGDGLEARLGDRGVGISVFGQKRLEDGSIQLRVPPEARSGMELYRTTDAEQLERARKSYEKDTSKRQISVFAELTVGKASKIRMDDICAEGAIVQKATGRPMTEQQVCKQLCKLGDTPFSCNQAQIRMDADAFMPVSALNALRRSGAQALEEAILRRAAPKVGCEAADLTLDNAKTNERTLLVHQSTDIRELLLSSADELYWQPENLRAAQLKKGLSLLPAQKAGIYLPPYLTEEELDGIERALTDFPGLSVVLNNLSQLHRFAGRRKIAGEGLNAFNPYSAALLARFGAARVTLSTELSLPQALSCAQKAALELIVYGRQPLLCARSCPLRAQRGAGGAGRETCSLCGGKGYALTDRMGETIPMRPYRTNDGCTLLAYNPHVLNLMPRLNGNEISRFAALRVIGGCDAVEYVRRALGGIQTDPPDSGPYTLGASARGVE